MIVVPEDYLTREDEAVDMIRYIQSIAVGGLVTCIVDNDGNVKFTRLPKLTVTNSPTPDPCVCFKMFPKPCKACGTDE